MLFAEPFILLAVLNPTDFTDNEMFPSSSTIRLTCEHYAIYTY